MEAKESVSTGIERDVARPESAPIPLVIAGPPRSGTTMFSALLDGHPAFNWLPDEAYFFEHLDLLGAANLERFAAAAALDTDSLIDGLRDRSIMPPLHRPLSDFPSLQVPWSEERFRAALSGDAPLTVRALWARLRDAYFAGLGYRPRRFVVIKAADFGRSVFGALDHFAEAKGILVVRNPVEMLNSLKIYRQKRREKLLTWPRLAEYAAAMNDLAHRARAYAPGRLFQIRHEDIVADRRNCVERLCHWLGIEHDPSLLQTTMLGRTWSHNSSFGAGEAGTSPLPEERARALSDPESKYFDWATEPFRAHFGYS